MKRWIAAVSLCLIAVACGGSDEPGAAQSTPEEAQHTLPEGSPTFEPARVLIDTEEGSAIIDAEKAETPEQQGFGLMHRESLDEDAGMVFLYFENKTCCFYMKNTLIPLSIAFFDEKGIIVKILDMEPCEADPCKLYDAGVPYRGALEVNQGTFERLGVQVGDRITVTH
jgi:uncharacterized membrane protein (UPF0127 family)